MQISAVVGLFADLQEAELTTWVERGWVRPEAAETGYVFSEIDVARVHLIHDLRRTMEVEEGVMPIVLSLLDQVYTLRRELRLVLQAVEAQPDPVRAAIRAALLGG
jgi:chaperone modulatory protein CbpM